jgi:epoxyqueuosine reductase QueG
MKFNFKGIGFHGYQQLSLTMDMGSMFFMLMFSA